MKSLLVAAALLLSPAAMAQDPEGLHVALDRLTKEGRFSGAVVIRYVPGLDLYFAGAPGGCMRLVTLYEYLSACPH